MISRRSLFRQALTAAALLALPLRRLTADTDDGWFAAIPMPPGWTLTLVQIVREGGQVWWRARTARYEPAGPEAWSWFLRGGWRSPSEPVETRDYRGTLAGFDGEMSVLIEEPRDGVMRMRVGA